MFGGFGNNQNSSFGNQQSNTGFGGSQFTNNTNTGFGGFGQASQQPQQQQNATFGTGGFNAQGFGSSGFNQNASSFNTGSSAFSSGQSKGFGGPSFGGFGQQQAQQPTNTFQNTNTFGMNTSTPSGFGSMGNTTSTTTNQGTGNPSYTPTQDKESGAILSSMSIFHSISAMPAYKNWSYEELRFADYGLNKKHAGTATGGGFGSSAFGSTMQAPSAFGATSAPQSNAFGSMGTNTGFGGFGASTTPAFGSQAQVTQAGSVFGAPTSTPAFGASTGAFGQAQATPFGQKPATSTSWGSQPAGSTFGATPAFGNQPAPAAATSSWGAPAASTGFGIQTTMAPTAFGQPTQPVGGLFGAKPASSVGFSFAPTTTTAPVASTGLFGAATAAPLFGATQPPAQSGSLFGATAAKPTGFSFGAATSAPAPFGSIGSTTTSAPSLFGSTPALGQPAATSGLFGAPAVTTQATTGLFGSATTSFAQPAGGLFGASTAPKLGGFGSFQTTTTPQTGISGIGTAPGAGLFGKTATPGTTLGGSSLFGVSTPGMVRPQGQPLTATIDRNPYGVNPLFTPSKATTEPLVSQSDPAIITVKTAEKKKPVLTPHFKVTPRSTSKVKLRGFAGTSPVAGQGLSEPKSALKIQPTIVKEQKVVGLDSRFTPRKTMTKLIISETPETSITSNLSQKKGLRSGVKEVTFDPSLEDVALSSMKEKEILLQKSQDITRSELSTPSKTVNAALVSASLTSPQAPPAKETDYMIEPPLSDLLLLSDEELKAVSGFKVSLEGVGWVKFLRPVDLLQASPTGSRSGIEQIPGSVVILEPKVCTVYPDEDVKPPCGFGLNVPAEINIEKCWPLDKSTKKPILDESDPRHDRHMQKLERMPGTKWLGFHNPSGTWRFRVEHFSRYGLIDEDSDGEIDDDRLVPQEMDMDIRSTTVEEVDEEDESIAKDSFAYIKGRKKFMPNNSFSEEENEISYSEEDGEMSEGSEGIILVESSSDQSEGEDRDANEDSVDTSSDASSKASIPVQEFTESLPSKPGLASAFSSNTSNVIQQRDMARKVQTMKSSLFSASRGKKQDKIPDNSLFGTEPLGFQFKEESSEKAAKREKTDTSPERKEMDTRSGFELSMKNESFLSSPKKYRRAFTMNQASEVISLKQSVLQGNEKQISDASFFMSRSFRVGWAGQFFVKRSAEGFSKLEITNIDYLNNFATESKRQVQSLKNMLEDTSISFISVLSEDLEEEEEIVEEVGGHFVNVNKIPKAVLSDSYEFSNMEKAASDKDVFTAKDRSIWKLASSLWDDIQLPNTDVSKHQDQAALMVESLRREKVSAWLQWALNEAKDQLYNGEAFGTEKIWNFLVCRRVDLAIKEALNSKNFRLATLLAQINGPSSTISIKHPRSGALSEHAYFGGVGTDYGVLEDITAQLRIWRRTALPFMDSNLCRIWKILSGDTEIWDVDLFQNLTDWKQFFGLFFWYGHGGHLSIDDVTRIYTSLSDGDESDGLIPMPFPDYCKNSTGNDLDICFNLIKLFVDEAFPLEQALKPRCFSSKSQDYLFPWITYTILARVKNMRDFRDVKAFFTEHKVVGDPEEELEYPVVGSTSLKGDMLTSNVINQLEIIGEWQWAIYVALFLSDHFQRAITIKKLLGRNYPIDDMSGSSLGNPNGVISSNWTFLVNQLRIPTNWIHESRALRARSVNKPLQEAISLFDANLFDSCHNVIMVKVAPVCLFSSNFSFLRSILTALKPYPLNDWDNSGDLVLNYLAILEHVPALLKKAELSRTSSTLSERSENLLAIEELKDVWVERIRSFNKSIRLIKLQRDSVWYESGLGTKCLNFISEKVENMMVDLLRIVGDVERNVIDKGDGLRLIFSDSKEWFSSILSV